MTHHVAVPLQGFVSVSVAQVAQAHVPLLQELLNDVTYLPAPVQQSADWMNKEKVAACIVSSCFVTAPLGTWCRCLALALGITQVPNPQTAA